MRMNTTLSDKWQEFQFIRYDLIEGEITLDEAITKMEKLAKELGDIVNGLATRSVRIALNWQQLEINAILYAEMLRQKKVK